MKKFKINSWIVLLLMLVLLPKTVYAYGVNNGITVNYSIHSSKNIVNVGSTVDVSIKISGASKRVSSTDITLRYDSSKFKYENISLPNNVVKDDWGLNYSNPGEIIFSYFDSSDDFSNPISSDIIITYTFKSLNVSSDSNGKFSFVATTTGDENVDFYTLGNKSGEKDISIHVPSTNNKLSSITVSGGTLSPVFNKDTTTYSVSVDDTSTTISAVAEASSSRISGTGKKDLEYGENKYTIIVTSESGQENRYYLTINRPDHRSSDATLKEMTVSNTDIKFNGAATYSATVVNEIESVTIGAKANDSKSTVAGTGNHKLKVGKNNIVIKVIAENGTTKQYTIVITREAKENVSVVEKSSNNYLSSITVKGASFVFDKNTSDYTLNVANTQSKLVLNYQKEDKKAIVKFVGSENLIVGNNSVSLIVTAEDGKIRTYNLTIIRSEEKITVENNKDAIKDALDDTNNSVTIGIKNNDSAITLDNELLNELKKSNKDLIFEWYDSNEVMTSSLIVKSGDITSEILNPNVSKEVKNETLLNHFNGHNYDGINIANSNLPKSTIYRMLVENQSNTYYLYYIDEGEVKIETLSVKDGYIEFKLDNGTEYVLSKENITTAINDVKKERNIIVPVLIVILIGLIFSITAVLVFRNKK